MGQILHGSAKTTHAVRAAIQRSKASIQELASRYDLNPKKVMKWRKRAILYDAPMGPKVPRSTVLSAEEEAFAVAFRKHTLLPLDDCLYALQANRISRDRRCIDCSSATRSAGFLRSKARQRARRRSSGTRSATSTSISPRCAPKKANFTGNGLLEGPDRGRPLQNPHHTHRQRHPVL
jgi:hypothetical protein